ncbi:MAG TPA: hypothetical protein VFH00_10895 [Candidatus Nitrosotalea sp.]|nr:hypothetical protein [Candidatus Nitrosotalea sp.]
MPRRSFAGLSALLMLVACGGSSPSILSSGPTASSVAVQTSDLPKDMKKCSQSADLDTYLNNVKTKDPNNYNTIKPEWDAAKKQGATAAYAAFYTDSAAHCANVESNSADVSSATYKLVVNFVIQFKDEASASKGYTTESIFGFSAASLKNGGAPVLEGTAKTGLSPNSIVLTAAIGNQSFYIAVWQNKVFMVILAILNIDTPTCKNVALAENSRIK